MLMTTEQDGVDVRPADGGGVQIDTIFGGTKLRTLATDMEAEEICELLWMSVVEARKKALGGAP